MDVNLNYYKTFYYVAKYHSFTKAANALFANQPNVTKTIKNLEAAFGCALFIRSNSGINLTPEGEKLFFRIKIAMENIELAEQELLSAGSLTEGTVTIGATENALHGILLSVISEFKKTYPNIRVKISNYSTKQALSALKNGSVDFAVVTSPMQLNGALKSKKVTDFNEIAICGQAFSHLKKAKLSLFDLSRYPLVCLGKDTSTYEFYSDLFMQNGVALSVDTEVSTTDQILPVVKNNLGIGFIPEFYLTENNGDNITVLNISTPVPIRSIYLVKRKDLPISLAAKELEKQIIK